ncbi:hypothetical protein FPZ43_14860 [Mucilaginibacter pallidiroseus]|uniref:Heavy metal binding domain-containing protein n=1 Tax=Mucilaginibacter pallidiroseus TaxID=2599295 RepID=A0A563U521_9SPHI|nr:heavy metal-binding domain-containing protein [Mucilaginibacter pallidiroseus]TWR26441.1 hypothetical protein FPZ43_14860 [Mucilaginibacter pallidiroseus]
MKIKIITLAIASVLAVTACNSQSAKTQTKVGEKTAAAKKYYCTMHPEIGSDTPGTCSKCGMDLVERDTVAK